MLISVQKPTRKVQFYKFLVVGVAIFPKIRLQGVRFSENSLLGDPFFRGPGGMLL